MAGNNVRSAACRRKRSAQAVGATGRRKRRRNRSVHAAGVEAGPPGFA